MIVLVILGFGVVVYAAGRVMGAVLIRLPGRED